MTTLTIVSQDGKRDIDIGVEMVERIKDVIYDYADRASLVTAIGALEMVKAELLIEQVEGE